MTRPPWRLAELAADLRALGARPGQDLLVHSSLRSIGPIAGRAGTLLDALRVVAGPAATIVVPAHTAGNSGSSTAFRAATRGLGKDALARYLENMPGFDPVNTPSQGMGAFAEYVRTRPGATRSGHPQTSFAAIGARAVECTAVHDLNCHFGRRSPLGWLLRQDAAVLLLGVGYASFTAFHLAEHLLPEQRLPPERHPVRAYHCVTQCGCERRQGELWDVDLDESDFAALGDRMDTMPFVSHGQVGGAACRLVPVRLAVEFAMADAHFQCRRNISAPARPSSGQRREPPLAFARDTGAGAASRYFYLSYPRLPPLPAVPGVDVADAPDAWVRAFFRDLSREVARRAAPGSAIRPGFLDTEIPAGTHWRSGLCDALGAAQVFVALLSPDYYRRSWPRREWLAYSGRAHGAGLSTPAGWSAPVPGGDPWAPGYRTGPADLAGHPPSSRRFAPVLWEPLPGGERPPGLAEALSLAAAEALGPYESLGLLALQRLPAYRPHYEQVVGELAGRIVALAERAPAEPSPVTVPEVPAPLRAGTGGRMLAVTVHGSHGQAGAPPAEYLRLAAERLGFAVLMTRYTGAGVELARHPGICLVEPDVTGDDALRECDAVLAALPPWVLPVVLTARAAGGPGGVSTAGSLRQAHEAYRRRPEVVRRGLAGVGSLTELAQLAPFLIAQAEREYLRRSPVPRAASRPVFRPRLAGGDLAAGQPGKENPDV